MSASIRYRPMLEPRYVTQQACGEGFAEVAERLLETGAAPGPPIVKDTEPLYLRDRHACHNMRPT